jgi:hypothetical protein
MTIRTTALQALVPPSSTTGSVLCSPLAWPKNPVYAGSAYRRARILHGSEVLRRVCGECAEAVTHGD